MAYDKLVDSNQLNTDLTSVANAIRTKGGTLAQLAFPADFVTAINNISGGGGGDSWESIIDFTKTINLKDDTTFDSITPSTSAQQIYAAVNGVKNDQNVKIETSAVDFSTYSYVGIGIQKIEYAWLSSPSSSGVPKKNLHITLIHPNLYIRDFYTMWNVSIAGCFQRSDDSFQTRNQGIVLGGVAFGTNSTNTATPKFSLQIPKITVQANASNFPVADVQLIDSENTNITCIWKLYRSTKKTIDSTLYNLVRGALYPS